MQYLFQDHMLPDLCPAVCRRIWPVFVPSYSGFILVLLRVAYSVHVYNILAGGSQRGTRCRQIADLSPPPFFCSHFCCLSPQVLCLLQIRSGAARAMQAHQGHHSLGLYCHVLPPFVQTTRMEKPRFYFLHSQRTRHVPARITSCVPCPLTTPESVLILESGSTLFTGRAGSGPTRFFAS